MNEKRAYENLQLNEMLDYTDAEIKRQYKRMALLYHPDKNKSPDASVKFQEIHESYEFIINNNEYIDADEFNEFENIDKTTYAYTLLSFLRNIVNIDLDNHPNQKNSIIYIIIDRITSTCEKKAIDVLAKLDKQILIKVNEVLKYNIEVFHLSPNIINKIDELIAEKQKNDEIIILNPTIDDLFENNLYKLTMNSFTYIVPLWHHELVYDNSGNDIYVNCYPVLAENMSIDNNNNLHVDLEYNMCDLWENQIVYVKIGSRQFQINPQLLKLSRTQTVVLANQGISKINTKDIYNVSKRGDVHLNITIFV